MELATRVVSARIDGTASRADVLAASPAFSPVANWTVCPSGLTNWAVARYSSYPAAGISVPGGGTGGSSLGRAEPGVQRGVLRGGQRGIRSGRAARRSW